MATSEFKRSTRRERFRAYMHAFNPTAQARDLIAAGLIYEDAHGKLHKNLAGRADLEPGSQQLLVGGIGSGKTTELLLTREWLAKATDGLVFFIDITAETDLTGFNHGALLASFGVHLVRRIGRKTNRTASAAADLESATKQIREFAFGKAESVFVPDGIDYQPDWDDEGSRGGYYTIKKTPGKLKPPLPPLRREIMDIKAPLQRFLEATQVAQSEVVVIFDGLDRLVTPERFWAVADQDLKLFRQLGVSVIVTAPIAVLYDAARPVADYFDRVHHITVVPTDLENETLKLILKKRGGDELLDGVTGDLICSMSGGVLRDLISLARDAAEESYVAGEESVSFEATTEVVKQLGNGYLRGLSPQAIKSLKTLESEKIFHLDRPQDIALLATRRVLEYSLNDFRVHPALLFAMGEMGPTNG